MHELYGLMLNELVHTQSQVRQPDIGVEPIEALVVHAAHHVHTVHDLGRMHHAIPRRARLRMACAPARALFSTLPCSWLV